MKKIFTTQPAVGGSKDIVLPAEAGRFSNFFTPISFCIKDTWSKHPLSLHETYWFTVRKKKS